MDLRVQEILGNAEVFQHCHGSCMVILAGNGLDYASLVQCLHQFPYTGLQGQCIGIISLDQGAVPQGVIQIPDHALDLGGRMLRSNGMTLDEVTPEDVQLRFQIVFGVYLHQIIRFGALRRQILNNSQILAGMDCNSRLINRGVIIIDFHDQTVVFSIITVAMEQESIGTVIQTTDLS